MTDSVPIPNNNEIPPEIFHLIRISPSKKSYLPIVFFNELAMRLKELDKINATDEEVKFEFEYSSSNGLLKN